MAVKQRCEEWAAFREIQQFEQSCLWSTKLLDVFPRKKGKKGKWGKHTDAKQNTGFPHGN